MAEEVERREREVEGVSLGVQEEQNGEERWGLRLEDGEAQKDGTSGGGMSGGLRHGGAGASRVARQTGDLRRLAEEERNGRRCLFIGGPECCNS